GRLIGDVFDQAEDGIRDFHVTGVQTCALPISTHQHAPTSLDAVPKAAPPRKSCAHSSVTSPDSSTEPSLQRIQCRHPLTRYRSKIGRASCRERGGEHGRRRRGETKAGSASIAR